MTIGRGLLIGVVAVATLSCAGAGRPAPERERTVLLVDNRGYSDMTIYVVSGARRTRMGTAGGLRQTSLTIPSSSIGNGGSISFVADPIGGNRQSFSTEVYVRAGETITLTIPP
jgi:hypothetical protein